MAADYHLKLRVDKCAVHLPLAAQSESIRVSIVAACTQRHLSHSASLETLGVVLGPDAAVESHMLAAVDSHESLFACLIHPAMPTQIAFSLLRHCAIPRLGFLARTVHPNQFRAAAEKFDTMALHTFHRVMQIAQDTQQPDVPSDQLRSLITLPLAAGGMGIRPVQRVSPSAYFASSASILPDFIAASPPSRCADYTATELHAHLLDCRASMLQQGVSDGTEKPAAASPFRAPLVYRNSSSNSIPAVQPTWPLRSRTDNTTAQSTHATTLHGSITDLWDRASAHVQKRSAGAFLQAEQLQHEATTEIEESLRTSLFHSSSLIRRTLMTANTAPHSSAYLTVLPIRPCYRMADAAMRLAVRHRLGLLPYDSLASVHCVCRPHTSFLTDPDHFHSCEKFKRTFLTQRHNNLVQVVMDLAINAGFIAIREPNTHIRPATVADAPADSKHYNLHADILLLKHDRKYYIDVTVARPTNESNLRSRPRHVSSIALASTRPAAQNKRSKYADITAVNGYTFVPFVMETYGGIGHEASQLLRLLSVHSKELSAPAFLTHAHKRLSVTLQSSNANIAQLAMESLHLHQHLTGAESFRRQQEQQRQHQQYTFPLELRLDRSKDRADHRSRRRSLQRRAAADHRRSAHCCIQAQLHSSGQSRAGRRQTGSSQSSRGRSKRSSSSGSGIDSLCCRHFIPASPLISLAHSPPTRLRAQSIAAESLHASIALSRSGDVIGIAVDLDSRCNSTCTIEIEIHLTASGAPLSSPSKAVRFSNAKGAQPRTPKAAGNAATKPTKPPLPLRSASAAAGRAAFAAAASPSPSNSSQSNCPERSSSSSYRAPRSRPNVWREIPSSCHSHFVAVAGAMFEAYGKLSSEGKYDRCAEVLNLILDLPSQALIKGGKVKELRQALESLMGSEQHKAMCRGETTASAADDSICSRCRDQSR